MNRPCLLKQNFTELTKQGVDFQPHEAVGALCQIKGKTSGQVLSKNDVRTRTHNDIAL